MNVLCYLLQGGLWARESFCPRDKRHSVCSEILHLPDTFPHTFCELSFPSPLPLLCELWTALKICLWQTLSVLGQLSDKHEVKDFKYGIGLTNTHTHIERNSHHWLLLMSKHGKNNKTHQTPQKTQGRECFYISLRSCKQRRHILWFSQNHKQNGSGWKGSQWVTCSNLPDQAGSSQITSYFVLQVKYPLWALCHYKRMLSSPTTPAESSLQTQRSTQGNQRMHPSWIQSEIRSWKAFFVQDLTK